MEKKITRLMEPIWIGKMKVKNRMAMAPMSTRLSTEFGAMTERMIDFYVERAKGGVGLIVIENTCIEWPRGKAGTNPVRIDDEKFVPGLNELVEAVHPYGTKIATQLQHTGSRTTLISTEGVGLVSASEIPWILSGTVPRALTIPEIEEIIEKFAKGADRTKRAGFDAVEIHGAHGYLITQFMSPFTNKRTDKYGGSFEARMRFPLEIVRRVKEIVGKDFPIIFRYSADEYVEGGITIDDSKKIAKLLQEAGVHALSVSSGIYESRYRIFPYMSMPRACNSHLSAEIKKVVDIPILVAGRINDPWVAEELIVGNKTDMVALGRTLLTDPYFPQKSQEGRTDDIRSCIACNDGCIGGMWRGRRLSCALNPAVGKEKKYRIVPTDKPKKIAVVGGGPAGLEIARLATLKGHKVTVYEQSGNLGGQLRIASIPEFKYEMKVFMEGLIHQIQKVNVDVRLNTKVDLPFVEKADYDVLVLATGAIPSSGEILTGERNHSVEAQDVLLEKEKVGKNVIVAGGGLVGCEIALYLMDRCDRITIIEKLDDIALDTNALAAEDMKRRMKDRNVKVHTKTYIDRILEKGVVVMDKDWNRRTIEGDSVVVALGYRPDRSLADKLSERKIPFIEAGDCVQRGSLLTCIRQAWDISLNL